MFCRFCWFYDWYDVGNLPRCWEMAHIVHLVEEGGDLHNAVVCQLLQDNVWDAIMTSAPLVGSALDDVFEVVDTHEVTSFVEGG